MYSVVVENSPDIPGEGKPRRSIYCPDELVENYTSIKDGRPVTTLYENFLEGVHLSDGGDFLGHRSNIDGDYQEYQWQTYNQVKERVTNFGAGLSYYGVTPGENFGVYSLNRPEWSIAELAGYMYNYVTVPLYDTLGKDAIEYIINQTELKLIIASTIPANIILNLIEYLPSVKTIIAMDGADSEIIAKGAEFGVSVLSWLDVERKGQENPVKACHPCADDLATICYTSGTTGIPKGALLTHKNILATVSSLRTLGEKGKFLHNNKNDTHISYLPLAHVLERTCQSLMIAGGSRIGFFQGDTLKLLDDIAMLKPTLFISVPRLFNRIYDRVLASVRQKGGISEMLFNHAYAVKKANLKSGTSYHFLWDRLVFSNVRARLGGEIKYVFSASAPLCYEVKDFLRICLSADVYEGYGQTEQAGGISVTAHGDFTNGPVGPPEFTGDVGLWDSEGRLVLIDRVKNIFKLSQGEYIAPEKIESVLEKHPLIAQIFVYGESIESCLVGIVVPNTEELPLWASSNGLKDMTTEEICSHPLLREVLLEELSELGREYDLKGFEIVKNIYVTPEPFTSENGLLTPTFKLKRHEAKKKYANELARLYQEMF
ncbi:hypothetical protein BGZ76_003151 [Entomortierella beljakovae]|nr:hypothetical protein BGZ76_003151 [Entomortierella beljakovae]